MTFIWHNGAFKPEGDAILGITDRALRGQGVFDTMLVDEGKPVMAEAHLTRLLENAAVLGIEHGSDVASLIEAAQSLIEKNGADSGRMVLNSYISIGPAARGLKTPDTQDPQIFMRISPAPEDFPPLTVIIAKNVRRNEGSKLSQIKSINYGDNILAYREAEAAGANEAIMLNNAGMVTCAATGNVFAGINGLLITPPLRDGVLGGTLRSAIIKNYGVIEKSLSPEDLQSADGLYITNSIRGAAPVVSLNGVDIRAPSLLIPQYFHLD